MPRSSWLRPEERTSTTLTMPIETHRKLRRLSGMTGVYISEIVYAAVELIYAVVKSGKVPDIELPEQARKVVEELIEEMDNE